MAKVRKAVITAAGRGTRQYPASTAVQKEMFPLVDRDGLTKPVIQIIGEEAIDSRHRGDLHHHPAGRGEALPRLFQAARRRHGQERSAARTGRSWNRKSSARSASGCTSPSSTRPKGSATRSTRRRSSSAEAGAVIETIALTKVYPARPARLADYVLLLRRFRMRARPLRRQTAVRLRGDNPSAAPSSRRMSNT